MIIENLKQTSKDYLGRDIKYAIITVKSYYNDSQRKAISDACKICGLNVLRIVNEETAAYYGYGLDCDKKKKKILVFNMRSNETNITILNFQDSNFKIEGTI